MVYLHVPFCESRCVYCGFFSVVPDSGAISQRFAPCPVKCPPEAGTSREGCFEAYGEAVRGEIEARREEIAETLSVNTLYIGGGTPSVLPLSVLSRVVHTLEDEMRQPEGANVILSEAKNLSKWDEFTIEVNPEDIVWKGEEYVRELLGLGVNRVSMGIQSLDDGILRWMNRRHDSATALEAFSILRKAGVENISIDLIFGLPQLSETIWTETINEVLALGPEHISAYQLSVEEGSALGRMAARGKFEEASDELCRRQYDILCERLASAGYHHYEISNFALPGREAIHNSAYWRRVPYVGLGPGAHSLSKGSVRSWNSADIPRREADGTLRKYSREEERLTPEDIRVERIMLPLRTDAGLPETELRSLAGDDPVDRLLSEGALVRCHPEFPCSHFESPGCHPERSEGSLRVPESRFFVSDDIIRELI